MWIVLALIVLVAVVVILYRMQAPLAENANPAGAEMLGLEALAEETFSLSGKVFVRGELWQATAERGIVRKGERVKVVGIRPGLLLVVEGVKDR